MIKDDDDLMDDFELDSILPKYIINSEGEKEPFDLERITTGLVIDVGMDNDTAEEVIESVVRKIVGLLSLSYKSISTNTVKDFICEELTARSFDKFRDIYERTEAKKKTKFVLPEEFIDLYRWKQPEWGEIGYITFKRTYARLIDGETRTEEFFETVRRVVEGCFSLQKEHCMKLRLPWDENKAISSAKRMYEKIWNFKFIAPGRGLWTMGTPFIDIHGSMALNNCGFASTEDIDVKGPMAFEWCMDALMLGVGVGFDTKGAGKVIIKEPVEESRRKVFKIPDSREGWIKALGKVLGGFFYEKPIPQFDYSLIRPAGAPIKGFGGIASGPAPLKEMLEDIEKLLRERIGNTILSTDIVDIFNLIGKCIVAGNVRRCIAKDQRVYTSKGMIPIEQLLVNDKVLTSDGNYRKIKSFYYQGKQNVLKVNTSLGSFLCTPNHRVAVYNSLNSYKWKRVEDLSPKDRLISLFHKEGMNIIDPNYAWLIGFYMGDGYVDVEKVKKRNRGGGTVSFAMSTVQLQEQLGKKLIKILNKLGYQPSIRARGNSTYINVYRKDLALELLKYKKANSVSKIPDLIWNGTPQIRASFLAGLADADGGIRNILLHSKPPFFCKQVQKIALSLGIATMYHQRPGRRIKGREKLYEGNHYLIIRGIHSQKIAKNLLEPHSTVWKAEIRKVKKNGLSIPYELIIDAKKRGEIDFNITESGLIRSSKTDKIGEISNITQHGHMVQQVVQQYRNANFDTLIDMDLVNPNWLPVEITGIEDAGIKETYDIEVEGNHEFICEGFLVHNSAEIALGSMDDNDFITLKQDEEKLKHHRWASNNSVIASVGMDYSPIIKNIAKNGEPGVIWLENAQKFSRMNGKPDYKDKKVAGVNPCGEQSLESFELCCLVETFPSRHESYEEFQETLKCAYLYAKSVTLQNTHWGVTNAVMGKNRRIGTSQSGIIDAFVRHGRRTVLKWCDDGYNYLKNLDEIYSDWLCIPKSIKITSVKPSGTVSLLPGVSPGIHYPHSKYYIRRVRIAKNSVLIPVVREAGYHVEDDVYNPNHAYVISFPIKEKFFERSKKDVSIWEQFENAASYQRHWSDNQVSITITFKPEEEKDIKYALECYEDKLKGVSLLPILEHGYEQAPYEEITEEIYENMVKDIKPLNLKDLIIQGEGEEGCETDTCLIKQEVADIKNAMQTNGCSDEVIGIKRGISILDVDFCLDDDEEEDEEN